MTDLAAIREIVSVYERNGWVLRSFALRRQTRERLGPAIAEAFPTFPVVDSVTDAAWFSRPSNGQRNVWEIRHLGETPYALLTTIDRSKEGGDQIRQKFEAKLEAALESRRSS